MSTVFPPLTSLLTPPAGQTVVVSGGRYFFYLPPGGASGNGNYTPVSVAALTAAEEQQAAQASMALNGSGLDAEAISVYLGQETPVQAGLIPPQGALVTVNGAMQVIDWQRPLPSPFQNAGYVAIIQGAPQSSNFPVVGLQTNALGQFVATGQVISPGALAPSGPQIPVQPDTPVPNPLPSGIYVGNADGTWPDGLTFYQTNADDTQPAGQIVLWLNTKRNGAPMNFYQKRFQTGNGQIAASELEGYIQVTPPADMSTVPVG